jgi:hypothetical protein
MVHSLASVVQRLPLTVDGEAGGRVQGMSYTAPWCPYFASILSWALLALAPTRDESCEIYFIRAVKDNAWLVVSRVESLDCVTYEKVACITLMAVA